MRKGRTPVPSTCVQARRALLDGAGPSRIPKNHASQNRASQIRASQKRASQKRASQNAGCLKKSPIRTIWRRWRTPPGSQMPNVFSIYGNWSVYIGRTGAQGSRKSFTPCDSSDNRPPGLQAARAPLGMQAARTPGAPLLQDQHGLVIFRPAKPPHKVKRAPASNRCPPQSSCHHTASSYAPLAYADTDEPTMPTLGLLGYSTPSPGLTGGSSSIENTTSTMSRAK